MFMGRFYHRLDENGRLIMPSKLCQTLSKHEIEELVITTGLDSCLFVFPLEEWEKIGQRLREKSLTNRDTRAFNRKFHADAITCRLDPQKRLTLLSHLKDHAKLNKDVVTIGAGDRIEIWDKSLWEEYEKQISSSYEEAAEEALGA